MAPRFQGQLFLDGACELLRPPHARERIARSFDQLRMNQVRAAILFGIYVKRTISLEDRRAPTCQRYLLAMRESNVHTFVYNKQRTKDSGQLKDLSNHCNITATRIP